MLGLLGLFGALMASVVADGDHSDDDEDQPEDAAPEGADAPADDTADGDDPPADLLDWTPDSPPAGESISGHNRDDILDGGAGDDSMVARAATIR
ncbi:MAG: hypothetical protein HZT43_19565 [Exiguobacterium profundum]|nr:MAG: hypothetical protein HZT43_19565 [Exiguobacterium profundum]